ncbi:DNA-binding IclR family transcriptional regulator [Skermanella aerolata]
MAMTSNESNQRGIGSIEVGGRILQILADAAQPVMLRDLAEAAKIAPGQAHAYLVSLRKLDLVEQEAGTGRYQLGPFALHLGLARLRITQPYQIASDAIATFSAEVGLAAFITVWGSYGPTVVRIQESSHRYHAAVRAGTVFDLSTTATGKLFSAFFPEKMIEPLIKAELKDPERSQAAAAKITLPMLRKDLEKIRQLGLSTIVDRPVPGLSALCAPVFDHSGELQLAITIMGPSTVVDVSQDGPQAIALLSFTRRLSEQLGYAKAA